MLDVGARVTGPADLLTTIDRLDPVYVTFRPSSEQLGAWHGDPGARALIRQGSPLTVQVVLADGSLLPRTGQLDFVAPALDAETGTQEFRSVFANADRILMPGQFVRVRLVGFARDSALAVPLRAVLSGLGRQFVYVVGAGDTAVARDVHPGPWSGGLWIIDRGLRPGDRVIVDGTQKVMPGRPVRPVPLADSSVAAAMTRRNQILLHPPAGTGRRDLDRGHAARRVRDPAAAAVALSADHSPRRRRCRPCTRAPPRRTSRTRSRRRSRRSSRDSRGCCTTRRPTRATGRCSCRSTSTSPAPRTSRRSTCRTPCSSRSRSCRTPCGRTASRSSRRTPTSWRWWR